MHVSCQLGTVAAQLVSMARANNGSGLRDQLARGETEAFTRTEAALVAALGDLKKASDVLGVSGSTLSRALADHLRLRRVRDRAAGRDPALSDLLLEVPPGEHTLALKVQKAGDAEGSLRSQLGEITQENPTSQDLHT